MAWYNRIFPSAGINRTHVVDVETKAVIGSSGDVLRNFLIYGAKDNAQTPGSALKLYESSTAVSIPVNKISEKFASLTPMLIVDGKRITEHPILDLLYTPNPDFDQELFLRNLAINYLVTGEVFFLSIGNSSSPPKQIYPLSPEGINHSDDLGFVTAFQVESDIFTGIYVRNNDQYWSSEGIRKLDQIRNFSIKDNCMFRGRSKLVAASDTARQQVLGTKHNLSVLEKGGSLSLIFHFDSELDDDEFQLVKNRIDNQFGGVEKAGQPLVTAGGGLQVENMSQSNQDMDWAGAQKMSANVLAHTYNYPLPLLSLDAATMSNYQSALEALYDDAVIPLSNVIFSGLQRSIFPRFKMPPSARLVFDTEKVPALVRRRNEQVKMRGELGVETDNELRNMVGREDYPGGDIIYKSSMMIPVGNDAITDDDDPFEIDDDEE